jgi:hypothetical protein
MFYTYVFYPMHIHMLFGLTLMMLTASMLIVQENNYQGLSQSLCIAILVCMITTPLPVFLFHTERNLKYEKKSEIHAAIASKMQKLYQDVAHLFESYSRVTRMSQIYSTILFNHSSRISVE